jgi:hypothetical protein
MNANCDKCIRWKKTINKAVQTLEYDDIEFREDDEPPYNLICVEIKRLHNLCEKHLNIETPKN